MNNSLAKRGEVCLAPAPVRVSERPGSIPLKTGDPIPDELRSQLNVAAFVRGLRESISIQKEVQR